MPGPRHDLHGRQKHSKVLTGCINCKRRHVKCDEGRPGCERCRKAGILCVGYRQLQARIFEPAKRSQASSSEGLIAHSGSLGILAPSNLRRHDEDAMVLAKAPDLRLVWQIALLDSFPAIWLPDPLVREETLENESRSMVPMSVWPLVAWKLARSNNESFVAHAILCLILCTLGTRTSNLSLVREASRHYARVLHHFQSQISLLAQSGYSTKQDNLVASLAAAGFCCSQVEYILQSWSNGDRHLQGMESLLQACGPLCLQHYDTRRIFYDHCLLWVSCSVVHRKPSIYSQWPWVEMDWTEIASSCEPARELLTSAARIPTLLEEYDKLSSDQRCGSVHMVDLLNRFNTVLLDLEALEVSGSIPNATTSLDVNGGLLLPVMVTGYTTAFLIHVVLTLDKITQLISTDSQDDSLLSHVPMADQLWSLCEPHVTKLCYSIDRLSNECYGMLTTSPLLFFIDAASIAYRTLAEHSGRDFSEAKTWLDDMSSRLAKRGYPPFRELGRFT